MSNPYEQQLYDTNVYTQYIHNSTLEPYASESTTLNPATGYYETTYMPSPMDIEAVMKDYGSIPAAKLYDHMEKFYWPFAGDIPSDHNMTLAQFLKNRPMPEEKTPVPEKSTPEPSNQKVNMQNIHYIQSIFDDTIKTVKVIYSGTFDPEEDLDASGEYRGKERVYTFKTRDHYEVGELAIIPHREIKNLFRTVIVVEIDEVPDLDESSDIEYKWVAGKFDPSAYDALVEEDKATKKTLKARMRQRHREAARLEMERPLELDNGKRVSTHTTIELTCDLCGYYLFYDDSVDWPSRQKEGWKKVTGKNLHACPDCVDRERAGRKDRKRDEKGVFLPGKVESFLDQFDL